MQGTEIFSGYIQNALGRCRIEREKLQEIRMRAYRPLILIYDGAEYFLTPEGRLSMTAEEAWIPDAKELQRNLESLSGHSLYAYEEELQQGYFTIEGGHRVGVAGKVRLEKERIEGIHPITFVNIRFAHEVIGCADQILPFIYREGAPCHTLILSPPGCGKTTMLRDLIRQISNGSEYGKGCTTAVADERSEIAGCFQGIPQNDVGMRTDVLDGCPKAEGMRLLLRSMSPEVIAVDEIGNEKDVQAIDSVFNCGCRLLATVHGDSMEDLRKNPVLKEMIQNHRFERYIVLEKKERVGTVRQILDENGGILWKKM